MLDVLVVGAGPAGAVAAFLLARAGVRVRLVDRATFPRDKLCGDTVNPGTLAHLRRLGISGRIEQHGLALAGIRVTGGGIAVEGRYPGSRAGRAILRRDLDAMLLEHAIGSGCEFESGLAVREAVIHNARHGSLVTGVRLNGHGPARELRARVTIGADGRRSTLAFGLGLACHPDRPRRWAIGAYFESPSAPGPASVPVIGEMHVRRGRYIGVEPLLGGMTNVCLVKTSGPAAGEFRDPTAMLRRELAADPMLRDRFAGARLVAPPVMLGPLAVEVSPQQIDGLLLAGDAAGFVDPMTGDGLRFAIEGGELAAMAALDALENGWTGVHARFARQRRRAFAAKYRFNRALRALVGSPRAVSVATVAARVAPSALRTIIACAGDCNLV